MWPGMKDQYMFNSQDACCNRYFFLQGNDCEVIDKCTGVIATYQLPTEAPTSKPTELPCESRRYHPKTDYKSCTNRLVQFPNSIMHNDRLTHLHICLISPVWTIPQVGKISTGNTCSPQPKIAALRLIFLVMESVLCTMVVPIQVLH